MRSGMNEVQATDIRQPGVSPERAITNSVGLTIRPRGSAPVARQALDPRL